MLHSSLAHKLTFSALERCANAATEGTAVLTSGSYDTNTYDKISFVVFNNNGTNASTTTALAVSYLESDSNATGATWTVVPSDCIVDDVHLNGTSGTPLVAGTARYKGSVVSNKRYVKVNLSAVAATDVLALCVICQERVLPGSLNKS